VRILRQTPRGLVEYRFDYDAYLAGKAPGTNIVLRAGDTIVVPLDTDRVPSLIQWASITQILFNLALAAAAVNSF
jgi:hypothetical protein